MPSKSKISQLPDEIQTLVQSLLREGESIQSITDKLNELNFDVSRSSVGRYTKNLSDVLARYKEMSHFAKAMGSNLEDKSQGEISRMNAQLLQGAIFKIIMGDGEKEVVLDPKEAMQLASSIEKLSKSQKLDTDREMIIREEAAKEAKEAAAKAAIKIARKEGFSTETVNMIKSEILGVEI